MARAAAIVALLALVVLGPTPATWAVGPVAVGPDEARAAGGFDFLDADFADDTTGWALGEVECVPPRTYFRCAGMLRTSDGGRTWAPMPAPPDYGPTEAAATGSYVTRVRFADERNGWVFKRSLFSTHDGGTTWLGIGLGTILALEATSTRVYVLAASCGSGAGNCEGSLRLHESPTHTDDFRLVEEFELSWPHRMGFRTGGGGVYALVDERLFARTAGGTWEGRVPPCRARRSHLAVRDERHLVATCPPLDSAVELVDRTGDVRVSADGGLHWETAAREGWAGTAVHLATGPEAIFVAPADGGLIVSRDGGQRFGPSLELPAVVQPGRFTDDGRGTALADGRIWRTSNEGRAWEPGGMLPGYRAPGSSPSSVPAGAVPPSPRDGAPQNFGVVPDAAPVGTTVRVRGGPCISEGQERAIFVFGNEGYASPPW